MSDIVCVTNRLLCEGDFLSKIREIAAAKPHSIILREKDLSAEEYAELARKVLDICREFDVPCTLHSFPETAIQLGADRIHLPLQRLCELGKNRRRFSVVGASVHSLEEARQAKQLGADYLTAGHIFPTDCKKGLAARGLPFLAEIVKNVSIPVYAIGGIDSSNIADIRKTDAAGACIMSGFMKCENAKEFLRSF